MLGNRIFVLKDGNVISHEMVKWLQVIAGLLSPTAVLKGILLIKEVLFRKKK